MSKSIEEILEGLNQEDKEIIQEELNKHKLDRSLLVGLNDLEGLISKTNDLDYIIANLVEDLIPRSMRNSSKAISAITLDKERYGTLENFECSVSSPIKVWGKYRGTLAIGYTEKENFNESLFEQKIADQFAERLGKAVERIDAEEARKNADGVMNHELKNKLQIITGCLDLIDMEGDYLKEQHNDLLKSARRASKNMITDIRNHIDSILIERGEYKLKPQPFDLIELIGEIRRDLSISYRVKKIKTELDIDQEARAELSYYNGERDKLSYLFNNIIKNAYESSPEEGAIRLTITSSKSGYKFDIYNKGVIPESKRSNLFKKNYVGSDKRNGSGVGAYTASLMTGIHNGNINFTTSEEEGTHVYIDLPRIEEI